MSIGTVAANFVSWSAARYTRRTFQSKTQYRSKWCRTLHWHFEKEISMSS